MDNNKETTRPMTISIYPSTEKLLNELMKKKKLSGSRIIDLAIQNYYEKDLISNGKQ